MFFFKGRVKYFNFNILVILFLLFGFANVTNSYATIFYIFKISSGDQALIEQTGFSILGEKGIITALHGVAGKKIISAYDNNTGKTYGGLKIKSVNIAKDLALLSSSEIIKIDEKKYGFDLSKDNDYSELHVIGYPFALSEPMESLQINIRRDSPKKLKQLIPPLREFRKMFNDMERRNSPNIDTEVLSIEGHILSGHSGAPILNGKNQVVGVANGSLRGEISWAIPYNDKIQWNSSLSELKKAEQLVKLPAPFARCVFQTPNGELLDWQKPRAGKMMTWKEANDYVADKNSEGLMGYHDWRLPAVGELQELAKFIKNSPGSYSDTDKLYWSSEDLGPYSVQAKVVNLGNAQMEWECFEIDQQTAKCPKNKGFSVRLVRSLIQ